MKLQIFFLFSVLCFVLYAQNNEVNDNVEIVLICKKKIFGETGIPLFNNNATSDRKYALFKDTLLITIMPKTDTLFQRKDTILFIDYQRSNESCDQFLLIPKTFANSTTIIIEFKSEKFIFRKRSCKKKIVYKQIE